MSEHGSFAVDRGVWEHPLFDEGMEFSRREAWLWLISNAAWKAFRVKRVGKIIEVARGQVPHSLRFMAGQWGWPEPRVRRFLGVLKINAMIDVVTDAGVTLITISKYDEYQASPAVTDAPNDAVTNAPPTHDRRNKEKTLLFPSLLSSSEDSLRDSTNSEPRAKCNGHATDDWPRDYRERFWSQYPNKVGKPKALAKLDLARKRGVAWALLWGGLLRYCAKTDDRSWCNPQTWINEERWTDEPATQTGYRNGARKGNGGAPGSDFFAGLAEVAANLGGDGAVAGDADPDIPFGRVNIDG